jgi:hypothetical protein
MLVLISAGLYKLGLDRFVVNIDHAILIYIVMRFAFNFVRGHLLLLPWKRTLFQWFALIFLSRWLYVGLISKRSFLFPDASTLGSELWLAVGAYLYVIASKVPLSSRKTGRYIESNLKRFQNDFSSFLDAAKLPVPLQALAYGIMLIENYNRSSTCRHFERVAFWFGKAKTFGIMQVKFKNPISDTQSVIIGATALQKCYRDALEKREEWEASTSAKERYSASTVTEIEETNLIHQTLIRYNPSGAYARGVEEILPDVKRFLFPESEIKIHPDYLSLDQSLSTTEIE